jgi:hypothetical protein
MPGVLKYLKRSSFYTHNVDVFITKLKKESGEFRESYAKSLRDAVEKYSVMRTPKIFQNEIHFAVYTFFDRCIVKDFVPS